MLNVELVKTITSDGLENKGLWINKNSEIAVLSFHGTAGNFYTHQFIDEEIGKFSKAGISILSANNRGHDLFADIRKYNERDWVEWVQIGSALEEFEDSIFDIEAWISFLTRQGVKKIILQGHSLGANKILYYQSKMQDERVGSLILLSPANDAGLMLSILGEEKYKKTNQEIFDIVNSENEKSFIKKELELFGPMSAISYFGYFTEEGEGNVFPYHDPKSEKWHLVSKITTPVLGIFGGKDDYIKPSIETAAEILKGKLTNSKDSAIEIIPKSGHSFVGFEEKLIDLILGWIKIAKI